jgi:hypothetical protein
MKRLFLFCLLCFPLLLAAQNEYRFTGTYLGNTNTGLRTIQLNIEIMQQSKWKWVHKALVTTGANLEMATVESDTNYDARSWKDIMADAEIKELYTHFMDTYLERIGSTDPAKLNTPANTTNNTITVDLSSQILTVQVRGIEGDKRVLIDICSLDNQYYVMYNKSILQYSANLLDISTVRLKKADYIVKVSPNKGEKFSGKISIY